MDIYCASILLEYMSNIPYAYKSLTNVFVDIITIWNDMRNISESAYRNSEWTYASGIDIKPIPYLMVHDSIVSRIVKTK